MSDSHQIPITDEMIALAWNAMRPSHRLRGIEAHEAAEMKAAISAALAAAPSMAVSDDRDAFEFAYAAHAIEYVGLDDSQHEVQQRLKDGRDGDRYKHIHDSGAWVGWKLARAALAATPENDELDESREDLFWKLHSLSKSLESRGLIDQHDQPEAYAAILDAMTLVRQGAAAAPVVLPEPVPTPCRSMFATQREYADAMAQHRKNWAELEAECALLATGGQAQAVEQAPVLYVSKGQLDNHRAPDGPDSANAGRYLPARITPAGNFTMPLFAAPQAQAVERIAIDMKQTAELLDLFGGDPTEFTVMQCNGHSGPGLYAYVTEYPEDGASFLGKTDSDATPTPQAQAVGRGEVLVTVSGFTGSGKSAIAGEIEILCRALGLQVEWPDGESEKNMTHADWTAALEQYKPRVRIVEQNIPFVSKKGLSK